MSKHIFLAFLLGTALQAGTACAADAQDSYTSRGAGKTAEAPSPFVEAVRGGDGDDIRVYNRNVSRQDEDGEKQPKILEDNHNRGVLYDSGSPVTYDVPQSRGRGGK